MRKIEGNRKRRREDGREKNFKKGERKNKNKTREDKQGNKSERRKTGGEGEYIGTVEESMRKGIKMKQKGMMENIFIDSHHHAYFISDPFSCTLSNVIYCSYCSSL